MKGKKKDAVANSANWKGVLAAALSGQSARAVLAGIFALTMSTGTLLAAEPLRICATVPELGMLASEIGGDRVQVESFVRGTEDPHFVDARPGFIRSLSQADMYIQAGMELEIGWAPVLLKQSRNTRIQQGKPGFVDASLVISPRDVPGMEISRSMGDVHPMGSPHYLTDPTAGLLVAGLIRDRLKQIDPGSASYYQARYDNFEKMLSVKLYGPAITIHFAGRLDKLALLLHKAGYDGFLEFLKRNGMHGKLAGWLGQARALQSKYYVGDHAATWSYLSNIFGLRFLGYMEPIPGVDPTTNHLTELAKQMQGKSVYILSAAYYSPRYASFLAEKTGATILPMANQGQARAGTDTYLDFIGYNISTLLKGHG
ncbi:MAG: zinc ABC transporter substrate-binding protein [Leptospiraceae bacterium]|nr:zinc ABC transporter substrate-binding protein [Leptospiraceae bacterium]MCB1171405.1 zinc ABC transporter substrate-binding protein [Leptospiraceae bacterium]